MSRVKSEQRIIIIPCSGIGKAFGTVSREATYLLTEGTLSDNYRTVCLPLLVAEDEDTIRMIKETTVYTIDGCPKKCATVSVTHSGVEVYMEIMVPKILAQNKDHKPDTVLDTGEGGKLLAQDIADVILRCGGS